MIRSTLAEVVRTRPPCLAMEPSSSAQRAIAAVQASTVGRTRRTASPVGPASSRVRGRGRSRSGRVLAPRSRAPARYTLRPPRAMTSPAIGSSASGQGAVSASSSSIQPSGVAHRIHASLRVSRPPSGGGTDAASTRPRAVARWHVAASSLVSAPTARNITAETTGGGVERGARADADGGRRPITMVNTTVIDNRTAGGAETGAASPRRAACRSPEEQEVPASGVFFAAQRGSPREVPRFAPRTMRKTSLLYAVYPPTVSRREVGRRAWRGRGWPHDAGGRDGLEVGRRWRSPRRRCHRRAEERARQLRRAHVRRGRWASPSRRCGSAGGRPAASGAEVGRVRLHCGGGGARVPGAP